MPPPEESAPPTTRPLEAPLLAAAVCAWLGAAICGVLMQKHGGLRFLLCSAQAGCDAVLSSKYSALLGIPLPWLGAALYVTALAMLLCAYATGSRPVRLWLLNAVVWLAVAGASFSVLLMVVQFAVLHAFCVLCTASALVMGALLLTAWRAERAAASAHFAGSRAGALALASFAAVASGTMAGDGAGDEVLAVVDARKFTRTEMEAEIGAALHPLRRKAYDLEFDWVKKKVDAALLDASPVKLAKDASERERVALLNEIARSHRVSIALEPPRIRALNIDLATAHTSGPKDARVQLVVFSDFQCQHCSRLAPVLKRVREEFPRDVLLAFRYFPLEEHPRARAAAIAAECAAAQEAFWPYHDRLFTEGGDLSDGKLLSLATALGLDAGRFEECRSSGQPAKAVEASYQDAVASGLEGAPSLFLDGKLIGGMVDYETLAHLIRGRLRAAE